MVLIIILAVAATWLLPIVFSESIVFDGDAPGSFGALVSDRRFALTAAVTLLAEWIIWFRPAGVFGPVSQILALTGHTVSYQALTGWPAFAALGLLGGFGVGVLLRGVQVRRRKLSFRRRSMSGQCSKRLLLLTAVAVLPLALCFWIGADGARQLTLQEVCRRERGVDEDLSYVVLKNNGAWTNAPKELFLTTDPDEPRQYCASELSVAPGETARITENADTFLSISRSGGDTVFLMDSFGNVLDTVELPELPPDTTYRRTASDWETAALRDAVPEQVAAPAFSAPGGFYGEAFDLTLQAEPGQEIYYTLDGSVPDTNAERYSSPIHVYDRSGEANRYRSMQNVQEDYLDKKPVGQTPVDKAFVVRAVAVDADGACSEIVTQTYFINQNDSAHGLVISLTADPDDLFGPDGIYVTGAAYDAWYAEKRAAEAAGRSFETEAPVPNYMLRGAQSERRADLEVFEDGGLLLNQSVGIRVHGNTSRLSALKNISVFSRAVYSGSGTFAQSLFGGKQVHSALLRGGLDNAISYALAEGRDVCVMQTLPVRVFLNGEYWYDTYLQEKFSRTFFAQTFHVSKENVEYITVGAWSDVPAEDRKQIDALYDQAESADMRETENYEMMCSKIDMQSYIDYCCIQAYLGNADVSEKTNYCLWRTKLNEHTFYGDGRWRWALNDMDLRRSANRKAVGAATDAEVNPFTAKRNEKWDNPFHDSRLYLSLRENADFRKQFALTFMDQVNTSFSTARVEQILSTFGETLDYDDGFFRNRASYMIGFVAEELGLSGSVESLTLRTETPDAGEIRLNTITPDLSSGTWSGQYYTDVPVKLTAVPAAGSTFDHWEVNGERMDASEIELNLQEGGATIHAIFR